MAATNEEGKSLPIDAAPEIGGQGNGFRPMELLLAGLAGCSAIDILNILNKQKLNPEHFDVEVTGERNHDNVPAVFGRIHVVFSYAGDVPHDKVERAAKLSMEKYCSVSKMLSSTATITHSVQNTGANE